MPDPDFIPEWAKLFLATAFGAGGLKFFTVWLESRRLGRKDYRLAMSDRIRHLETSMSRMQSKMGNLRVENALLKKQNSLLKEQNAALEAKIGGGDEQSR